MARTPLFRLLQQLHRRHRAASAPVAVDNVPRVDRRSFLLAAGAVVAAPSLGAACGGSEAPLPGSGKRVVVVGGGIAGLHCAHRLRALGVDDVALFEAQERLGGRIYSDRTTFAPLHCELGAELIDTGHETMRALADEFGLALLDYEDDDADLERLVTYLGGRRVPVDELLAAYAPIAARIDADLATIGGDGYVTYDAPNGGEALDDLSITGWFDRLVGEGVIAADNVARQLFELAYTTEYGRQPDEQSALNLLFLVSTSTTDLALYGDSDERFRAADGNDAFITALAGALGDVVTPGHRLTALRRGADGRFTLSFATTAGVVEEQADEVVLALPFTMLREVALDDSLALSSAKRLAIDTLGYGTNAKLMVGFRERVWRNGQAGNTSNGEAYADTGFQSTWETSRLQTASAEGIITHFTGGTQGVALADGTPAERAADFVAGFDAVFPGVAAAFNDKVARFHWPTNAFVKASYACYLPGQYATICGAEGEAEAAGHLHFCGEHTSLDFQGYMEGGALTGATAAVAVAANLGVDTQALLVDGPAARILARADVVRRHRRLRRRR